MGTYFTAASWAVTSGNIVYATDLNNPLSSIDTGLTALMGDIRTGDGLKYGADTGEADTYEVSLDPAITSYEEGLEIWLKPANTNTGASTLNVNSLGAKSIRRFGLQTVEAGDLLANYYTLLKYDGTYFQIVSVAGASTASAVSSAAAAALSATAAADSEDAAAISAATINLPTISGSTALDVIRVNAGKTGYEFVQCYTEAEVDSLLSALYEGYDAYIKVSDTKAAGTDSGTFTQGAWQTRDISNEDTDTGSICSVSANQITLEAGTYLCRIKCPAFNCSSNQARLYDTTGTATLLVGSSEYSSGTASTVSSVIVGRFTLSVQSVLEVQHYCNLTQATNGFGVKVVNAENEVFTVAEFWREA